MIRICGIALTAVLLAGCLRTVKPDFVPTLTLAASVLILGLFFGTAERVLVWLTELGDSLGISELYMEILLKVLGITYVAELTAGLCRDAGHGSLGSQVELAGKWMVCAVSLPVLLALWDLLTELLGAG
ncbi:MAG: stage III sporulation AC/AD family protein [Lachnospiraceae bacterium]|nr:stage III sporulation AC/AD family protein [Lachnospiraceae bacterium]